MLFRSGARFSTYASWWIKQAIKRTLINAVQPIHIPAYMVDLIARWKEATRRLEEKFGRQPTTQELADDLKIPVRKLNVVRRAVRPGAGGITVSTLKEAEQFFAAGYRDILYAVGIAPNKLEHVAALRRQGCDLTVILDNLEAAAAVADKSAALGTTLPVLIEIDSDGHRAGVKPDDTRLLEIGRVLGANLLGGMTHAGGSYDCQSIREIRVYADRERAQAVLCAEKLRAAGLRCPIVSVGSTPTATYAQSLAGVTEVRVGVYMFFDLFMAGLGVCAPSDIALSVLCSVIGHQPGKHWIITDAGWMALSRDRGTAARRWIRATASCAISTESPWTT